MLCEKSVADFKEMQELWHDGIAFDYVFEKFVLAQLSEIDAQTYEIGDLLSDEAIALLLEHGEQQLKHEASGGMRMLSDGKVVDTTHLAPQCRKLFAQWSRRGWVELGADDSVRRC